MKDLALSRALADILHLRRGQKGCLQICVIKFGGDIVYVAGIGNCLVKWDDSDACWLFDAGVSAYGYQDVIEDIEDIRGNIHQNPELLTEATS